MTRMGVEWIKAAQSEGVIGNVKHYAVNNQEGTPPGTIAGGTEGSRQLVDVILDERTLREMYLPHFEAAVKEANVGSVMCSYNKVNGQYACENEHLLMEILKGEWGFQGYVLADYGAAKSTHGPLMNGLDFEPWPGIAYSPTAVNAALATGVPESAVDEHVRRILRTLFAYGFFDRDAYPYDDNLIDKPAHADAAQRVDEAGMVLMQNDGVLPLDPARVKSMALIGSDSETLPTGGGRRWSCRSSFATPREGIESRAAAAGVEVSYDSGEDADQAAATAAGADVAVVVVADAASEGTDKPCMGINCGGSGDYDRDALIERVAAANPRTVVVLETAAPVLTPWRGKLAALLEAWYPGVYGGKAIARMLFGDVNPCGHLPATFPKSEGDMPYAGDPEAYPGVLERVVYKEGVLVGYRWFDEKGIVPAYPFGHGLSYTTFRYSDLRIRERGDGGATVAVDITNMGKRAGAEVPQLYLGLPDAGPGVQQPPKALRGFQRLSLRPKQTKTARFRLTVHDLSYWHVPINDWRVAPGCYAVMVGSSSRDIRLQDTLGRGGASCPSLAGACLSRRAPLGPRGIGRVRLGLSRARLRRLPGLRRRTRRVHRYCVRGGRGKVVAVLSRRGRARLVVTTAQGHRHRRVHPGVRLVTVSRAYPRLRALGAGLYRAYPGSRRLVGVRRGRVRFIAVADRRLLGKPAALRAHLRRAGV